MNIQDILVTSICRCYAYILTAKAQYKCLKDRDTVSMKIHFSKLKNMNILPQTVRDCYASAIKSCSQHYTWSEGHVNKNNKYVIK